MRIPKTLKVVATDTTGVVLIILSPFIGILPGPGGIPMFLAGLGLLSVNHLWAKKFLIYAKQQGVRLADIFFPEHKLIMLLYDALFLILAIAAFIVLRQFTGHIGSALSTMLLFAATAIFLSNRKRLRRIVTWFKRLNARS